MYVFTHAGTVGIQVGSSHCSPQVTHFIVGYWVGQPGCPICDSLLITPENFIFLPVLGSCSVTIPRYQGETGVPEVPRILLLALFKVGVTFASLPFTIPTNLVVINCKQFHDMTRYYIKKYRWWLFLIFPGRVPQLELFGCCFA